jgi:hypothetical protein
VKLLQDELDMNIKKLTQMQKSSIDSNPDKFLYSYLEKRVNNETFSKLFEVKSDPDNFYILAHNNKNKNLANLKNPFYGEVSISKVRKDLYLEENEESLYDGLMQRQPSICLHDFIPGTV